MLDEFVVNPFDDSIKLQLEAENTPIQDYIISIHKIFDNLKLIKNLIEKMMKYLIRDVDSMIKEKEDVELIEQYANKKISDMVFEIKTFWNIFGSIMLPIRNYSPFISRMYSIMKDDIKIDILDLIFKISCNNNFHKKFYSSSNEEKITQEYGNLVDGFSRLLISVEKISALENIYAKNINYINWAFMTFLNTSVNNIKFDLKENELKISSINGSEENVSELKLLSSEFLQKIDIIYEYVSKTDAKSVLDGTLNDFLCALINVTLFNLYEDLKTSFNEHYKLYRSMIDSYKLDGVGVSMITNKDRSKGVISYIIPDKK